MFDIAIIGAGPAGLSAALTGRIRNKEIALFEYGTFSEKLQKAAKVDNYLGLEKIDGKSLMEKFSNHALSVNPTLIREKVNTIFPDDDFFTILTPFNTYEAKSIIIATGTMDTFIFKGEKELLGRGVSYCATCDGRMFEGKNTAVVSYTIEGEKEASFLAQICKKVYYLPQYKGDFSKMRPPLEILPEKIRAIEGETKVEKLLTDKQEIPVDGIFILRKSDPVESLLAGIELDGEVVKVNRDMSTSIKGVFAAGDATGKPYQIAKAVGEGLTAVLSAINYLDSKE